MSALAILPGPAAQGPGCENQLVAAMTSAIDRSADMRGDARRRFWAAFYGTVSDYNFTRQIL